MRAVQNALLVLLALWLGIAGLTVAIAMKAAGI